MKVLFISQCSKNALVETRKILDQFAERCGDRAWKTEITEHGLKTIRKLLKATARRNTAVACHWMRSKHDDDLIWIVGNANKYNKNGCIPTNTTARDILKSSDENDWHTGRDIQILVAISALFHDFGKANSYFQDKLNGKTKSKSDPYRHEWVSLRIFQAFVGHAINDESWLNRLNRIEDLNIEECFKNLSKDGVFPFEMPPLARAIGWLILSHHFLPVPKKSGSILEKAKCWNTILKVIDADSNGAITDAEIIDKNKCWVFKHSFPFLSQKWQIRIKFWAASALKRLEFLQKDWLQDDLYSIHLARLCLMFGDHYYSSQSASLELGDSAYPLYANTERIMDKKGNKTIKLKQRLDEHLLGVEKHAVRIAQFLPHLKESLSSLTDIREFIKRSKNSHFRWQDNAYDLIASQRDKLKAKGFFGVNLASTGSGKTLANGKIMCAIGDVKKGIRFNIALGLRTLTLQTGEAYRDLLKLEDDDLAILVGSREVRDLFELHNGKKSKAEDQAENIYSGSESEEVLFSLEDEIVFEGAEMNGPLDHWLKNNTSGKKLLTAPILVCTIDHLIGATEGIKGGKQILPMLRLLTSDLVLDEPDDFDMNDLPALTRLVHWAGLLGSRILLSSATLPPTLIGGLFNAYQAGRIAYEKSRGKCNLGNIVCAWFDENDAKLEECQHFDQFMPHHTFFIEKRVKNIKKQTVRRKAQIKPIIDSDENMENIPLAVAKSMREMMQEIHHSHHSIDPHSKKRVSFGLIRMANIDPLIDVTQSLFHLGAPEGHQIRICCYHSRHPLLIRSMIENKLDQLLNRKEQFKIFDDPMIRNIIENHLEKDFIFVVVATPVAEVGRDHDYDWSIVEPSSMRSIIQLAGRVKRHRNEECKSPNIYLLSTNLKTLKTNGKETYSRPGFEKDDGFLLESHQLNDILQTDQYEIINSISRIVEPIHLKPNQNLVHLEHMRMRSLMLANTHHGQMKSVNHWWNTQVQLTGVYQKMTPFRTNPEISRRFALLPDQDDLDNCISFYDMEGTHPKKSDNMFIKMKIEFGERMDVWNASEYMEALEIYSNRMNLEPYQCAMRFGTVELPERESEWIYHPSLGFRRKNGSNGIEFT